MKSALITGAGGYIGSRLALYLAKKGVKLFLLIRRSTILLPELKSHSVIYYDNSPDELIKLFESEKIDAAFHLASIAKYGHKPEEISAMIESNITLGTHILDAMSAASRNRSIFINTGTYWQNYDSPEYKPICLYAATKQAFEDIIDFYSSWRGISCVTLKLTDIYGGDDSRGKIFSLLKNSIYKNELLPMTGGEQKISFIHVEDAIRAYESAYNYALGNPQGHNKFFVAATPIKLKDAVLMFEKISGREIRIEWGKLPYRQTQIMNPQSEPVLPGWKPEISLEEGIRKML